MSVNFRQLAQRIRVPSGFVLLPLLLIASRPTRSSVLAGVIVSLAGLGIRAWASGHLRKNKELTTTGPYAHTRNPLYLGTFLLGLGVAISTASVWFVAVFAVLYLMIYVPVMLAEAETIRDLFPDEYEHYRRNVPIFLPRFTPYRRPGAGRPGLYGFDTGRYIRHREYRAALGLFVVYLLIAAKYLALQ